MIRCVIFDIGDTLYSNKPIFELAEKDQPELKVLAKHGHYFSIEQYFSAWANVRKDWKKLRLKRKNSFISYYIQKYLGIKNPSWSIAREMHLAFEHLYGRVNPFDAMEPNTIEIIQWLAKKGYYLGIISDAETLGGKRWLEEVKLSHHFHHISISCQIRYDKSTSKPFELFLKKIRKKHHITLLPEECLVVGDSSGDMNAKLIGMKTALYKKEKPELKNSKKEPDFFITNLWEVKGIVEKLRGKSEEGVN